MTDKKQFKPYDKEKRKNRKILQQEFNIELKDNEIVEIDEDLIDYENGDNEDCIPKSLCQHTEKAIIDAIKAGLKYNKDEDSKYIKDLKTQLYNIRKRTSNDDKNNYICFYGSKIFPKENGKEKFDEKISLYDKWYNTKQPEIFDSLKNLYKIYFKYSKYHTDKIVDDDTIKIKINKILIDIDNELNE